MPAIKNKEKNQKFILMKKNIIFLVNGITIIGKVIFIVIQNLFKIVLIKVNLLKEESGEKIFQI